MEESSSNHLKKKRRKKKDPIRVNVSNSRSPTGELLQGRDRPPMIIAVRRVLAELEYELVEEEEDNEREWMLLWSDSTPSASSVVMLQPYQVAAEQPRGKGKEGKQGKVVAKEGRRGGSSG